MGVFYKVYKAYNNLQTDQQMLNKVINHKSDKDYPDHYHLVIYLVLRTNLRDLQLQNCKYDFFFGITQLYPSYEI